MKRLLTLLIVFAVPSLAVAQSTKPKGRDASAKYGSNKAVGKTFVHDGIELYYETYGAGSPLLLVHGNGGSIQDMSEQIAYFRKKYRVIAMDSRDHGRSADSPEKITYEKMTDDLAALIDHLKAGPVYVLGWSDGGIEALMLGIRHPAKVQKIASMAANLNPTERALWPESIAVIRSIVNDMPAAQRSTPQGRREFKVTSMMLEEWNIDLKELGKITAPTLIMAGDHDVIQDHHTVDIFQHIPNGQLAIFPNALHTAPYDDPALFNATVDRFFSTPFVKKDRIGDLFKSLEKLRAP